MSAPSLSRRSGEFLLLRLCAATAVMLALAISTPAVPSARLRSELETAISRRVARDRGGRIYLLRLDDNRDGQGQLKLRIGSPWAEDLADFGPPIDLLSSFGTKDSVRAAGLVIDRRNRLHLVWSTAEAALPMRFGIWPARLALSRVG